MSNDTEKLLKEIVKLHRYSTQYMSREMSIHQTLGVRGSKYLCNIFEIAARLQEEKLNEN